DGWASWPGSSRLVPAIHAFPRSQAKQRHASNFRKDPLDRGDRRIAEIGSLSHERMEGRDKPGHEGVEDLESVICPGKRRWRTTATTCNASSTRKSPFTSGC